jgi:hypothetical protein
VPTDLPWLSEEYRFGNGTRGNIPSGFSCDAITIVHRGYVFKWQADGDGIVTLSTCEYSSADTSISVMQAAGFGGEVFENSTCMGRGSDNGYCGMA